MNDLMKKVYDKKLKSLNEIGDEEESEQSDFDQHGYDKLAKEVQADSNPDFINFMKNKLFGSEELQKRKRLQELMKLKEEQTKYNYSNLRNQLGE